MNRGFWDRSILRTPPDLSISEDYDGLLIKVFVRGRIIVIVSTLATVGCVLLAVDGFVPHRAILIIAAVGAALGAVMSLREQKVTLRVTNLEFETLGYFGGSYRHRRSEPRMSILGLEYRNTEGVPGLYADTSFYWACLLPYATGKRNHRTNLSTVSRYSGAGGSLHENRHDSRSGLSSFQA